MESLGGKLRTDTSNKASVIVPFSLFYKIQQIVKNFEID